MPLPIAALVGAGLSLLPKLPQLWDQVAGIFGMETPKGVEEAAQAAQTVSGLIASGQASPEQVERIQIAMMAHEERILELRNEQARIANEGAKNELDAALANVQGARAKEVDGARAGMGFAAWGPPALVSALVTIGFIAMLYMLLESKKVSTDLGEGAMLLLGSLSTAFGAVVNYYLGSSLGSMVKDHKGAK